jgi:hypothetical protein
MDKHTDTARFLQAVFPGHATDGIFANLHPPFHTRDFTKLDGTRDCYFTPAAFAPEARTNLRDSVVEVRALVIDDVGTAPKSHVSELAVEMALGVPTAITRSSKDNYQWAYRLARPVAAADWEAWRAGVEARIAPPVKLDNQGAQCLFRLPMGVNTDKGRGGTFAVELVELNPEVSLDPATIVHGTLTGAASRPGPAAGPAPTWPVNLRRGTLQRLMDLIPNTITITRDTWVNVVGHGLKALCEHDDEGFEVFDAWSQTWEGGYDAGETKKAWDSFGTSGLRTKGGELRAFAEATDKEGFRQWDASLVFDDGADAPEAAGAKAAVKFKRGKNKEILTTMDNAARALEGLGLSCRYDQFHHRFLVSRGGKSHPAGTVERLSDHLVLRLRAETVATYGKDFGPVHTGDAIMRLGLECGFNPVVDMLAEAQVLWDGVGRLDRLGPDYFHSEDTELARACFRKVMIAAVRRARRPGVKFDQILVTESPEGWDKSSAWAVLAGEGNFSDADILGKDARSVQEELADVWVHEIADLSGLSRADVEHVKAFASRVNDRARPAYGRYLVDQPRQSIEVGTTNSDSYLLSQTGNRRFWPFKLGAPVDIARLRLDRMALWGEAAAAEAGGETLVLDQKLWGAAGDAQEKRRVVDTWEDELANLVEIPAGAIAPQGCERIEVRNGEQFISSLSVMEYLSGYRRITLSGGAGRKIMEIMKRLGWERCMVQHHGKTTRGYTRPVVNPSSVMSVMSVMKKIF